MWKWLSIVALAWLPGCSPQGNEAPVRLLEPRLLAHWHRADIPKGGDITVDKNDLVLSPGSPMTGARFRGWTAENLPLTDYEVTFEARRVEGQDFFAALTFPVRSLNACATLVLGGWGGALVGISSIDEQDASENSTRSEQHFVNGQWYSVRLQVTNEELKAWIDDRLVVNTSIKGRKISLRPGDIEQCAPFGFASYATKGEIKGLAVRRL